MANVGRAQSNEAIATQLRDLTEQMSRLRQELADSRRESTEMRQELREFRAQMAGAPTVSPPVAQPPVQAKLAEDQELLAAKVTDQYQTKVESGSKYRVKLSGMALFNAVSTHGAVSSLDLPDRAVARQPGESNGAFGASMRQSIFGLDVAGPVIAGAKTRGEIRADFFGGLPDLPDGATSGIVRLRTGKFALDWTNTSLEAGLEAPFFSPRNPTSLVSSAYPALWSAGNLWAWTPQVHATHRRRYSDTTSVTIQYGILDPLTGEVPASEYNRTATAGERNRAPAVASRVALERRMGDREASAGAGVYYSRQHWGFDRRVNSWTATADWEVPLGERFSLSGELYRGRAMAGLGGGLGSSVLLDGVLANRATRVLPVNSTGGWMQLQFKPSRRWSVNGVFGGDFPFRLARGMVLDEESDAGYAPQRNSSGFLNAIYQPRSNLLFSVEYRKLWTTPFDGPQRKANHVSVGAAILF